MTVLEWLLALALLDVVWWVAAAAADTRIVYRVAVWIRQPVRVAPPLVPAPVRAAWHYARMAAARTRTSEEPR